MVCIAGLFCTASFMQRLGDCRAQVSILIERLCFIIKSKEYPRFFKRLG